LLHRISRALRSIEVGDGARWPSGSEPRGVT
jgi:hypothetical protein